jgi:hypothetical protein
MREDAPPSRKCLRWPHDLIGGRETVWAANAILRVFADDTLHPLFNNTDLVELYPPQSMFIAMLSSEVRRITVHS